MASRSKPPARPERPILAPDQKRRALARLVRRIQELEAFDPQKLQQRDAPEVAAIETAIDEVLSEIFGHGSVEYGRYQAAATLDHGPRVMRLSPAFGGGRAMLPDPREAQQYVAEGKKLSLSLLQQAKRSLEEEIAEEQEVGSAVAATAAEPLPLARDLSKVFIVHGHDGEVREAVARFISEKLGFEPVILHERPNKGRTIISKFREEAGGIGFAVVLMTPDDLGKAKDAADLMPRARQNVVFELGFFIGSLGPGNVAAIVKGDLERPSDFDGVVYISFDSEDWRTKLGRELEEAGYEIDWNKVMRK